MKLAELEKIVTEHLIDSAGVNKEFREGIKSINSKMNWVLTLISGAVLVILAAWLKGH